jgi:dTDP-4-dehydrorhamnose 3,5-epimerase
MELIQEPIPGLMLVKPKVFEDHRGYFFESYNQNSIKEIGIDETFVQDNQSKSNKGVLRGLHFQVPPAAQGKLVRVVIGSVFDVAVDLRSDSEYYGKWFGAVLSSENKYQLWVPPGFAHGYLVLEDETVFSYKCTEFYQPDKELGIMWNDKDIGIEWNIENPILSTKDEKNLSLSTFNSPF